MTLTDGRGRKHDYLRISVTDRCNLRCIYCMGEEGIDQIAHSDILSYEEILKVVEAASELGISKIRITGGEPLIRKGIVGLVKIIAAVPGITDLSMTTNSILLPRYAARLKEAGLKRVNISLDSLNPDTFRSITRRGDHGQALAGIDSALKEGLKPVKINVVLMKGINEGEVLDFLDLAVKRELHVRFIEYMPIGECSQGSNDYYLPLSFVEKTANSAGLTLTPLPLPGGAGPAESYTLPSGKGTVGLIHPISKHFCQTCNRLRLTADGFLKACLYWQEEQPVRPVINDRDSLKKLIESVLREKPSEHQMSFGANCGEVNPELMRAMSKTGG